MMGQQAAPERLFYDFCLEDHAPVDHLLRRIDRLLDLSEVRQQLKPFYSQIGRPSIDPELMIRMLILGYCFGIRSERRLCAEVHLNLAYRWFCRLGLDGQVPDHTTFSRNRHGRFRDSDAFRLVFESVVCRCMAEGLVGAEGFAVDASVMEADASRYHGVAGDEEIDWSDPTLNTRAVREYLAALDPEPNPNRKPPKAISLSDPASAWTAKANKRVLFGYGLNYLIDNQHAIIVDVEATPARTYDEVAATETMVRRTQERFGLKPQRLAADTAYGTGKFLGWLMAQNIEPHIPLWDKSERDDGTFMRADFTYDKARDLYVCPGGKPLTTTGRMRDGKTLYYRASKLDCDPCPFKSTCCPKSPERRLSRDINEAARDEFLLTATVQNLKRLAKNTTIPPPQPVAA